MFWLCHFSHFDFRVFQSNQIFHYTPCIVPKRVTSWRGSSSRHCARVAAVASCKQTGQDLNLRLPFERQTRYLPLECQSKFIQSVI